MESTNEDLEAFAQPNDFGPDGTFTLENPAFGTVTLAFVDDGGRLKLEISNEKGDFYRRNSEGVKVLSITCDAEITFLLDPKVAWAWADQPGPFRLKKKSSAQYYRIKKDSVGPDTFILEAKASGLDKHDPKADQPFNLYVLIEQVGDRSFPVCIDPGDQNPPR